jgi:hypothetical protein
MVVRRWWWHGVVWWSLVGCAVSQPALPPTPHRDDAQATPVAVEPMRDARAAQPLQTWQGVVDIDAPDGAVDYQVYDAMGQRVEAGTGQVIGGQFALTTIPRGAVGQATMTVERDGKSLATSVPVYRLDPQSTVETDVITYTMIYTQTVSFLQQSMRSYELNGRVIRGYRSPDNPLLWLRDHVYQAQGFRYFERDMTSLLEAFRDAQRPDGSLPDWVDMPELGVKAGRKDVESDLEFLFVQGIYEAWQATGDTAWMRTMLPAARKAIDYTTSNPLRWNAELGLVRRPYTIDMWDFEYGPTTTNPDTGQPAPRHWIDENTVWGIFHGDNTGVIYALRLLAIMEATTGDTAAAQRYRDQSDAMHDRLLQLTWNGGFLTHFVPEDPTWQAPGVDMAAQLSISNAYALNRGIFRKQEAQYVLDTYYARGQARTDVVLPWFSIDPPFPAYAYGMAGRKGELPGEYVNGGIMPIVGGELAQAALRYQYEPFGFDTLKHYAVLIQRYGGSYLWYYPNGQPGISGPDTVPYDGWGAAAMLAALMEGAAGVTAEAPLYGTVRLEPRWVHDPLVNRAYVVARDAAADGYVAYTWQRSPRGVVVHTTGSGQQMTLIVPLPADTPADAVVLVDGQRIDAAIVNDGHQPVFVLDSPLLHHVVEVSW